MPKTKQFKKLLTNLEKNYLGEKVPKKYQKRYGKRYDKSEIESMGYAIARSKSIKTD